MYLNPVNTNTPVLTSNINLLAGPGNDQPGDLTLILIRVVKTSPLHLSVIPITVTMDL